MVINLSVAIMFRRQTNALQVASKRTKMEEAVRKQNILVSKFCYLWDEKNDKMNQVEFIWLAFRISDGFLQIKKSSKISIFSILKLYR